MHRRGRRAELRDADAPMDSHLARSEYRLWFACGARLPLATSPSLAGLRASQFPLWVEDPSRAADRFDR